MPHWGEIQCHGQPSTSGTVCPTEWVRQTTANTLIAANHDTPSVGPATIRYKTTLQSHGLFKGAVSH